MTAARIAAASGGGFARFVDVKCGTCLRADGGFVSDDGFCIPEGAILTVQQDADGDLFVPCTEGTHYLDGQLDNGVLVGFYLVEPAALAAAQPEPGA